MLNRHHTSLVYLLVASPLLLGVAGAASLGCSSDPGSSPIDSIEEGEGGAAGGEGGAGGGGGHNWIDPDHRGDGGGGSGPNCAGTPGCGMCISESCCEEAVVCYEDDACIGTTVCIAYCTEDLALCVDQCRPQEANPAYEAYTSCMIASCSDDCPDH
jgi:hypothetical protein